MKDPDARIERASSPVGDSLPLAYTKSFTIIKTLLISSLCDVL